MSIPAYLIGFGMALAAATSAGAGTDCPDLALVLSIDASSSIDDDEFRLQTEGYAAAFANPVVLDALRSAGTVDVAGVVWADAASGVTMLPWTRIETAADAMGFAEQFLGIQRLQFGDTDIGNGLWKALDLLEPKAACGTRMLVNLSGDGRASTGSRHSATIPLSVARERAAAMGVTVNGLAITNAEGALDTYFEENLITGAGSFVVTAANFSVFGTAIAKKLDREIRPMLSASLGGEALLR